MVNNALKCISRMLKTNKRALSSILQVN